MRRQRDQLLSQTTSSGAKRVTLVASWAVVYFYDTDTDVYNQTVCPPVKLPFLCVASLRWYVATAAFCV